MSFPSDDHNMGIFSSLNQSGELDFLDDYSGLIQSEGSLDDIFGTNGSVASDNGVNERQSARDGNFDTGANILEQVSSDEVSTISYSRSHTVDFNPSNSKSAERTEQNDLNFIDDFNQSNSKSAERTDQDFLDFIDDLIQSNAKSRTERTEQDFLDFIDDLIQTNTKSARNKERTEQVSSDEGSPNDRTEPNQVLPVVDEPSVVQSEPPNQPSTSDCDPSSPWSTASTDTFGRSENAQKCHTRRAKITEELDRLRLAKKNLVKLSYFITLRNNLRSEGHLLGLRLPKRGRMTQIEVLRWANEFVESFARQSSSSTGRSSSSTTGRSPS